MPSQSERIVLVGGGRGLSALLIHLKKIRKNLKAVQTVFDRGGHTGKLRDELRIIAIGDMRRAMGAMTNHGWLGKLMNYRFNIKGVEDVPLGNLIMIAIHDILGGRTEDMAKAINLLSIILGIRGKIIPVSLDDADVKYIMSDKDDNISIIHHEGEMDTLSFEDDRAFVGMAYLDPWANINPLAYRAIVRADKIVLCAGSLYTSLVPNLLVGGFREALHKTQGQLIYVVNLMTHSIDSPDFTVTDFVRVVHSYTERKMDVIICNAGPISERARLGYAKEGSSPVTLPREFKGIEEYTNRTIVRDLVEETKDGKVYHSKKLAEIIARL